MRPNQRGAVAVKLALWRDYFERASADDKPSTRREAWRVGTEQLTAEGVVGVWADWAWLA